MQSRYANAVPSIVAEMENERVRDDGNLPPGEQSSSPHHRPEKKIIYVYPVEGGGVYLSETKVEDEDTTVPIVDAEPETDQRPRTARQMPYFLHFLLLLFLFLGLDNVDAVFAQFAPTVTVTITPMVKTVSTTANVTVGGAGAQVQGRVFAPLTLTQEQTVPTTGRGYQRATNATGTLMFYNGSSAPQYVSSRSVFTDADGVNISIDHSITVPAANLPAIGSLAVSAHAILAGSQGNIAAFDINLALSPDVKVRNEAPFSHGRDERHFSTVAARDIDGPAAALKAQVTQASAAALQGQLRNGEQLLSWPCTPVTATNQSVGDEASQVTVVVFDTCRAVAYDPAGLQTVATQLLTTRAATQVGRGYTLYGQTQISATASGTPNKTTVVFSLRLRGTWVYQINQTQVKSLVAGRPRLLALHLLAEAPGVQTVSIAGVSDNTQLPVDPAHIHLNILSFVM